MSAMDYKPHIDGLRAVAVTSVLVYHLKISWGAGTLLPGGFLGVDVFFVLSGYLITRILLVEGNRTGRIDIGRFYWRRSRRILPPLLLVMLCSLPVAWQLLSPSELDRFAGSLLASLGFVSNIFWFIQLGEYGAQSGLLQPFLHTWSLAIEEQFYLFFPLLLIVIFRRRWQGAIVWVLVVLAAVSLMASQLTTWWHGELSFFSPLSRAWEMLAGSLLACHAESGRRGLKGAIARQLPSLAMLVILVATALIDLSAVAHPGIVTLPIVLATCLLIHVDDPRAPMVRLLSSAPMVHLGKLSYSLYLWHFPIFAFARLSSIDQPSWGDYALWLGLTWGLSWAGYHLIERPFRFHAGPRVFVPVIMAGLATVLVFSGIVWTTDLDSRRMQNLAEIYGANDYDNERLRDQSWDVLDALAPGEQIDSGNAHGPSRHEAEDLWYADTDSRKILVIGNSHSKDVFNSLHLNAELFPQVEFARFGIHRLFPAEQIEQLLGTPNFAAADVILVAARYPANLQDVLPPALDAILGAGKEVILIGPGAEFSSPGSIPIFDWFVRRWGMGEVARLNQMAYRFERKEQEHVVETLHQIATERGLTVLDRRTLTCDDAAATCALSTPDGMKTYYDESHWTLDGARLFGRAAADLGWVTVPTSDRVDARN